jgi:hypothetical protein
VFTSERRGRRADAAAEAHGGAGVPNRVFTSERPTGRGCASARNRYGRPVW